MLKGHEVRLYAAAVKEALAEQLSAADGKPTLILLIALVELDGRVIKIIDGRETLDLVLTQNVIPDKWERKCNDCTEQEKIPQLNASRKTHAQEHEEEDDRSAVITLQMAKENRNSGVKRQKEDLQRIRDLIFFAHNSNVFGVRQHEEDLYKLTGLKSTPGNADPRLGVNTAAALYADAENERIHHGGNGDTGNELPKSGDIVVVDEGQKRRSRKTNERDNELCLKIVRIGRTGYTFQQKQAEDGYTEH